MALDLDISELTKPGRKTKALTTAAVRELQPEDLQKLEDERGVKPTPLQKISARHERLAMLIASGHTVNEASIATGYTRSRISILMRDEAFLDRVETYKTNVKEVFLDQHELLADLSKEALLELHERMADDPEAFTNNQLFELLKITSDRSGFGPSSQATNVNVSVNMADRLQSARQRIKTINGEAKDVTDQSQENKGRQKAGS